MGRWAGAVALCAATALAASSGATAVPPQQAVRCADSSTGRVHGARVLLDTVVLPRSQELARPARAGADAGYRWFRPARIAIRSGEPDVAVAVPLGWRHLAAVSFGGEGASSSIRFARCSAARGWVVFEGGFHLRDRTACMPLAVRAGGRTTTVRIGLGRACGARG